VTLIQCSKGAPPPRNPRVALVLAGGAVSGGAFKVGALKAFDECLVGRRVTDFDTYVGLSAGSLLAAALAGGIEPDEMIRVLDGSSQQLERLRPLDFYRPNAREMLVRAGRFWLELGTYLPGLLIDLVRVLPELPMRLREPVRQLVHEPSQQHLERLLGALAGELAPRRAPPSVWALTPSGLFDNEPLGQWLARQMGRVGVPDDFGALYRERGRKLFISATELDTARAVVFGPTNDRGLTISQAVQASSALPGFIRPARFDGIDYVDGGVRHTADIEVAVDDRRWRRPDHLSQCAAAATQPHRPGPARDRRPRTGRRGQPDGARAAAHPAGAGGARLAGQPGVPGRHRGDRGG
jgi:predicted acylesterase/phospholipase RssA